MTLEVCNAMTNIENCNIEFDFHDMVPDPETELATKQLEEMNSTLFSDEVSDETLNKSTEACLTILQSMETSQTEVSFFPTDVQNCVEVESTTLTSISDSQILEIQFHDENGFVNTKYLVNNEIVEDADVSSDLLGLENSVNEEIIQYAVFNNEIASSADSVYTVGDMNSSTPTEDIALNTLNPLNISVLSPQTDSDEQNETDLTSLNWLHNITNIMSVPNLPTPPVSPPPKPKKKTNNGQEDLTININFYKKNGDKKPPFSYATLICMAMGKNGNKMTLSAIYHWIKENFLYYRKAHPSWQVSSSFKYIFFVIQNDNI